MQRFVHSFCDMSCDISFQYYKAQSRHLFLHGNGDCHPPLKGGFKIKVTDQGMEWYGVVVDVLRDSNNDYWIRASYDKVKGAGVAIQDPRVRFLFQFACATSLVLLMFCRFTCSIFTGVTCNWQRLSKLCLVLLTPLRFATSWKPFVRSPFPEISSAQQMGNLASSRFLMRGSWSCAHALNIFTV